MLEGIKPERATKKPVIQKESLAPVFMTVRGFAPRATE